MLWDLHTVAPCFQGHTSRSRLKFFHPEHLCQSAHRTSAAWSLFNCPILLSQKNHIPLILVFSAREVAKYKGMSPGPEVIRLCPPILICHVTLKKSQSLSVLLWHIHILCMCLASHQDMLYNLKSTVDLTQSLSGLGASPLLGCFPLGKSQKLVWCRDHRVLTRCWLSLGVVLLALSLCFKTNWDIILLFQWADESFPGLIATTEWLHLGTGVLHQLLLMIFMWTLSKKQWHYFWIRMRSLQCNMLLALCDFYSFLQILLRTELLNKV